MAANAQGALLDPLAREHAAIDAALTTLAATASRLSACELCHNAVPTISDFVPLIAPHVQRAAQDLLSIIRFLQRLPAQDTSSPSHSYPRHAVPEFIRISQAFKFHIQAARTAATDAYARIATLTAGIPVLNQETRDAIGRQHTEFRAMKAKLEDSLAQVKPSLDSARAALDEVEKTISRRKQVQIGIRTTAVVSLPFIPVLSAALTVVDIFVVSVVLGLQERTLFDLYNDVINKANRVHTLQLTLREELGKVNTIMVDIEKLDRHILHPDALVVLKCELDVIRASIARLKAGAETLSVSRRQTREEGPAKPELIRELRRDLHALAQSLKVPELIPDELKAMSEASLKDLDGRLAAIRAAAQRSARSRLSLWSISTSSEPSTFVEPEPAPRSASLSTKEHIAAKRSRPIERYHMWSINLRPRRALSEAEPADKA